MSVHSEIARLETAKAAIKTAIEGKGVTVPEATLLDGMAALIESIEAGGASGISFGVYTPATTGYDHTIEHGLGTIPKIFVICCGTYSQESSKRYMLDFAHGFSDRNLIYQMNRVTGEYTPRGTIVENVSIMQTSFAKNTAIANANIDNIRVGGNYQLFAGFEYYWFALA